MPKILPAALALLGAALTQIAGAANLTSDLQKTVRAATFEVVLRKSETDRLTYERPPPLDLVPFAERNDKYWSLGSAFAIGANTYVTAAHVLNVTIGSQFGAPLIRDVQGHVYPIDRILKYSLHEDFAVFSIRAAPAAVPLTTATERKIDDPVFAVGNALGEGIVIRDGLLTSETPEEFEGRWKYLRFSAPASPGNSGGPLLDSDGRVIGIVRAKSQNENLNYALPISRVLDDPGKSAVLELREAFRVNFLRDPSLVRFKDEFPLPQSFESFSKLLQASMEKSVSNGQKQLFAEHQADIFPLGKSSDALAEVYEAVTPALLQQSDEHLWKVQSGGDDVKTDIPDGGHAWVASDEGTILFRIQFPKAAGPESYVDTRKFMDLLLKGLKLPRVIGGDQVRITSMGNAAFDHMEKDRFGRRWNLRAWPLGYADAYLLTASVQTPEGAVGFASVSPSSVINLMPKQMMLLADYTYFSYSGTVAEWQRFLADKEKLPPALASIKLDASPGHTFTLSSKHLQFGVPDSLFTTSDADVLNIHMAYVVDHNSLQWDIGGVKLARAGDESTFVATYRRVRPANGAAEDLSKRWKDLSARSGDYSGRDEHDADLKTFWLHTTISAPVSGSTGADALPPLDTSANVLYELLYQTKQLMMPTHFDAERRDLLGSIKVHER